MLKLKSFEKNKTLSKIEWEVQDVSKKQRIKKLRLFKNTKKYLKCHVKNERLTLRQFKKRQMRKKIFATIEKTPKV